MIGNSGPYRQQQKGQEEKPAVSLGEVKSASDHRVISGVISVHIDFKTKLPIADLIMYLRQKGVVE